MGILLTKLNVLSKIFDLFGYAFNRFISMLKNLVFLKINILFGKDGFLTAFL